MNLNLKKEILYISNSLSVFRLLLVIPISLLLLEQSINGRYLAIIMGIIAIITDGLDGYFARKYNQITDLGKIIDPIADKLLLGVVALIIVLQKIIPLWFFIILVSRDLIILMGGLYLKQRKNLVPQSNILGKVTAGTVAFYILISLIFYPHQIILRNVFLWIGSSLIIISFIFYVIKFFKILKEC